MVITIVNRVLDTPHWVGPRQQFYHSISAIATENITVCELLSRSEIHSMEEQKSEQGHAIRVRKYILHNVRYFSPHCFILLTNVVNVYDESHKVAQPEEK